MQLVRSLQEMELVGSPVPGSVSIKVVFQFLYQVSIKMGLESHGKFLVKLLSFCSSRSD